MEEGLFLGLDCSTQTLKATIINTHLKEIHSFAVNYDTDLPQFKTKGGVHHGKDGLTVTTPTQIWIAALDLLFEKMKSANFPFASVLAVSGSGQQHGSVYWNKETLEKLGKLDSTKSLLVQSTDFFSVADSPIWMDSSTTEHCKKLEEIIGGPEKLSQLTGSVAYERFTINQIRKIYHTQPKAYEHTERISLVSSFVCSLLIGGYAPIDAGDASGMNAMNLRSKEWIKEILEFAAPHLEEKLGKVALAHTPAGNISKYFVDRYGFSKDCLVITFSGDNPCSLAGLGMKEGDVAVSLGTSDTMFGPLSNPNPSLEGHVFCDPVHPTGYMALLCYKNGSLTREHIRDQYAGGSWQKFNESLSRTNPGNDGNIGFYFKETEITPKARIGTYRFDTQAQSVNEFDSPDKNVRAVVEAQFLSMFVHSTNIGLKTNCIFATGGASTNKAILQILSDVFGVPVFTHSQPNSASLGAAFRALHGWKSKDNFVSFDDLMKNAFPQTQAATPNSDAHKTYMQLVNRYKQLEQIVVTK